MRALRSGLGPEEIRFFGDEGRSVVFPDEVTAGGLRLRGNGNRVGSHVGNQADMPLARIDSFIELLGKTHRRICREPERGTCRLLKRTGDERRRRIALARLVFNGRDLPCGSPSDCGKNAVGIVFVADFKFAVVDFCKFCREAAFAALRKNRGKVPVLFRNERLNLPLSLADKAERHRLHASSADPPFDPRPQQRTDHISDNPIENAPRLLRINQIHVQIPRMLKRLCDGGTRDLMECDPFERGLAVDILQDLVQMPGDRLSFAVRVGRQIDFLHGPGGLFQFRQILAARFGLLILRRKIMLDIDSERTFRQIPDMAVGRFDDIILPEDFSDCFRLRRRLDYNQFIRHDTSFSILKKLKPEQQIFPHDIARFQCRGAGRQVRTIIITSRRLVKQSQAQNAH